MINIGNRPIESLYEVDAARFIQFGIEDGMLGVGMVD